MVRFQRNLFADVFEKDVLNNYLIIVKAKGLIEDCKEFRILFNFHI